MKPIIITLLALPIVGFLHHNPQLPPKTTEALVTSVSQQKSVTPPKAVSTKAPAPATVAPAAQPVASASVAATTPVVVVSSSNPCSAYSSLFNQYGWDVSVAEAICDAESRGNPNAVSQTDDYGLMQINHGYEIYGSAIYDPAFNIKIAYTVKYVNSGWYPWTTYTSGLYLSFL